MLLEILIIAFVIYKTLYYLRSARGSYVLAGIIILLGVMSLLSRQLHLEVITFLLNWILTWLPIGLFIIFQPEIRRAFAQLGSFAIWKGKRRREVIGELVAATGNMARRKCGALIVVEHRDADVDR